MSDSKKKLIILTAGGTGGHVYPADALAQELEKRNYNLMLVTDQRGLNNYHGKLGEIENKAVLSGALVGKNIWFKIKSLIKVSLGILQSVYIIIKYKPECVVGFGGYASFPCAVAAILTGTDLIIHEQNSVMSRTNRFLAKYASKIATSFPKTKYAPQGNQTVLTGMPVRTTISALFDKQYKQPEQNGKFNLLVLGGSQGAKIFSEVIPQAIKSLDEKIQQNIYITQQCRKDDIELLQKEYSDAKCSAEISNFFKSSSASL
jgi:UDP-N-acetylglucosamine--N-acetylmuramyl-(pentapeptide) pyrophosphoryl-undecaprenol N-acetylglucosamine transferase